MRPVFQDYEFDHDKSQSWTSGVNKSIFCGRFNSVKYTTRDVSSNQDYEFRIEKSLSWTPEVR